MPEINTEMVKQLRKRTGAGVMDCKNALTESGGDEEKAVEIIQKKGLAKLYRDKKGTIQLTKATYAGLRKAHPREYYHWVPDWVDKEYIF